MCLSRHFAYSLGTRVLSICYVKTFGNTMLVKSCQGISRNTVSNGLHCKHDVFQRTSRSTLSTRHDPPMRGFTHFAWKRLETPVGQRISRNSIRKPVWIQPAWMKPKKDIINKEARRTEPAMEKYFWEVQSFRMLWSKMVLAGTSRGSTDVMGRINTEPYVGGCGISSKRRRWQGCDRLKKRRNLSMRFRLLFQTLRVPMRQIQPQPSTWRNSIRQTMAMKMIKSKIMRWRCTSCGLQKIEYCSLNMTNTILIRKIWVWVPNGSMFASGLGSHPHMWQQSVKMTRFGQKTLSKWLRQSKSQLPRSKQTMCPLISAINDADQEEFVSVHVISKHAKKKRYEVTKY